MNFHHDNGIYIPHLSASTVNSFIENRFGFYQSKVKRAKFQGNPYTARGKAVEHAVNVWVKTQADQDYVTICLEKYDEDLAENKVSKIDGSEQRALLPGLTECALRHFKEVFEDQMPITQHSARQVIDDAIPIEFLMYLDYFRVAKDIRDCKVVSKTPSALSQGYKIQGSLYRKVFGLPVYFDFIVPNKVPVSKTIMLSDDDYLFGISYLKSAAKAMLELNCCDNPARVMELMSYPDLSSFYNHEERKIAAEAWGIQL